jgi:hypothetical protein
MTVLELRNKLDERVRDGDGDVCVCAAPADRLDDIMTVNEALSAYGHGYHNGKLLNLFLVYRGEGAK